MANKIRDIAGQRCERARAVRHYGFDKNKKAVWQFACDCGRSFTARTNDFTRGRVKSCGCIEAERLAGDTSKHPLYHMWKSFQRKQQLVTEWNASFDAFMSGTLATAGTRPSDQHFPRRVDTSKPMGPGNAFWKVRAPHERTGRSLTPEQEAERRLHARAARIRTRYGAAPERCLELAKARGCEICGSPEAQLGRQHQAVDHCHRTGAVRGMLCHDCNLAIGFYERDKHRHADFEAYLAKYAPVVSRVDPPSDTA